MPFCRLAPLVLPLALLLGALALPDAPVKPEDLVFVQKGTLPIIVSVPHGGQNRIPGVPKRRGVGVAKFATVCDTHTIELTRVFATELERALDGKLWLVVAAFDRKYVDVNRPPSGAYESDLAKPYYDAYHQAIVTACQAVKAKHGRGLLLDIHGQATYPGAICRGTKNGKTVQLLKERYGWPAVTGKSSVVGELERAGYPVMPKCSEGADGKEDPQFTGEQILDAYGSHTGYAIDAIMLEIGGDFREPRAYPKTARALARAVAAFHNAYLKE